jgi:hypothetical protein
MPQSVKEGPSGTSVNLHELGIRGPAAQLQGQQLDPAPVGRSLNAAVPESSSGGTYETPLIPATRVAYSVAGRDCLKGATSSLSVAVPITSRGSHWCVVSGLPA